MEKATIMDIQRYSIHDGPGIRTTVFFKGCHMRCRWCHNPESQCREPEMMFFADQCVACGGCRSFCKRGAAKPEGGIALSLCRDCPEKHVCAENCPAGALRLCGVSMSVDEVLRESLKDKPFYGSSADDLLHRGGVTCSGGEPLLQSDFTAELLKRCHEEGVGTCVDTTFNVEWEQIEKVLPFTDIFLVDLKLMDDEKAVEYTGRSGRKARSNLQRLSDMAKPVIIRIPLVDGVNDTLTEESARQKFLSGLSNIVRVDRLPVTDHAGKKYSALQREDWLAIRKKADSRE